MSLLVVLATLLPGLLWHFAIWLLLASFLLNCLELRHPETYVAMGGSSLRLRNGLSGSLVVLKFVMRRGHRPLGDKLLSILSISLLTYVSVCILAFSFLVILAARLLVNAGAAA